MLLGAMTVPRPAVFMGVQVSWLFGGAAFLKARTGLTVAEYARRGFFELVCVALLVIPVLLASRALTARDAKARRLHTQLALPLIVLVCAMMGSAVERMQLYVGYFGLTTDRFFALIFMAWLAVVLVWLVKRSCAIGTRLVGVRCLRRLPATPPSTWPTPARSSLVLNLSRLATVAPGQLPRDRELAYLARLGDGAVPPGFRTRSSPPRTDNALSTVSAPQLDRCLAALRLLSRSEPATWQQWNADEAQPQRVQLHSRELRAVAHSCPRPAPSGGKRRLLVLVPSATVPGWDGRPGKSEATRGHHRRSGICVSTPPGCSGALRSS